MKFRSREFVNHKSNRGKLIAVKQNKIIPRNIHSCEILAKLCTVQHHSLAFTDLLQAITDTLNSPWENIPAVRRENLQELRKQLVAELFPSGARAGLEA